MKILTIKIRSIALFVALSMFYAQFSFAQFYSATVHVRNVDLHVVSVDSTSPSRGEIRVTGDCVYCGNTYRFNSGTSLETPFYKGVVDVSELEKMRFSKAYIVLNTSSGTILDIYYVPKGS